MKYEQLTENFNRSEFACKGPDCCGGSAAVDSELVEALQDLRNILNVPLHVNSGFRCLVWNRTPRSENGPGSNDDSQHPKGTAADIALPEGMTMDKLLAAAEAVIEFSLGGIGIYDTFIHLDVRSGGPARWNG